MTNNLKAERTLTAEELQNLVSSLKLGSTVMTRNLIDALEELQRLRSQSLSTQQPMGEVRLPRLTQALICAAAEGHYGKHRVAKSGGPKGIAMTVDGRDWSFDQAFKRMWKGLASALHPNQESDE